MQRLVYSPRVYVFIKNSDGDILDVSRYVVSGSITRKLNAVSPAEVTLRNPKMIFTTPKPDGSPVFTPMDPITIYLKRVRGRPVRVFTGFLDTVPYLQLFPGTVSVRASCTLKRLLYTFFDPALQYTQSFLTSYGWLMDAKNPGQWFSLTGLNDFRKTAETDAKNHEAANDGSVGTLLYATMKYIGHWNPEDIYIEKLPTGLFSRMAALAAEFEADNLEAKKEFEELLKRIIGEGGHGAGSEGDLSGLDTGDVAETIYKVGKQMKVGDKFMLAAFMTGIVESGMKNLSGGDADSAGWRQERKSIYPDPTNVPNAARRFFEECRSLDTGQDAGELAADVQRPREDLRHKYADVRSQAVALLAKIKERVQSDDNAVGGTDKAGKNFIDAHDPDRTVRSSTKGGKTKGDTSSSQTRYDAIVAEADRLDKLGGTYVYGGGHGKTPAPANGPFDCSSSVSRVLQAAGYKIPTSTSGSLESFGKAGPGKVTIYANASHTFMKIGDRYFGTSAGGGGTGKGHSPAWIDYPVSDSYLSGYTVRHAEDIDGEATNPLTDTGGGGGDGVSQDNAMASGSAAAFAATINFPSFAEVLEASALTGQKSLMNDKPLFPFVQQLVEASMRSFQSMPDGKFFAFYPDYFGETFHRKPYWLIDNIEIMDGKVELSDDALVTHEFVVGDTMAPPGGSTPEPLKSVFSSGVVTVFNAFMSDAMLNRQEKDLDKHKGSGPRPVTKDDPRGMDILISKDEAVQFLNRYGARPQREDVPMIKHPYFEMFLAYQRFMLAWSRQFLTTFTFTFMPELFPGGKVGFPDHGLQMYIDEVSHSWDYESGFITQANLSAPAVMTDNKGQAVKEAAQLPNNMVKAIITPALAGTPGGPSPKHPAGKKTSKKKGK